MKVAVYCRVSTNIQNIEQQRTQLVEYCKNQGWQYRTYMDEAMSGKLDDRPQWLKLQKDVEKGGFDKILVLSWDRITRSLQYAIKWQRWLTKTMALHPQLELVSLFDGVIRYGKFGIDPDKIFQFKLKCLLSEYELMRIKQRSKIGIERAKAEGKYKGRKPGSKNKK